MSYPVLTKMRPEEADAVLSASFDTVSEARNIISTLNKRLGNEEISLQIEREMMDPGSKKPVVESTARNVSIAILNAIRSAAEQLYKVSSNITPIHFSDAENEAKAIYKDQFLPQDGVEAYLENEGIFLRLPMLWSRNNKRVKGAYGREIGPDHSICFRDSVHYAILCADNFDTFPFENFSEKLICGLYVYHDIPAARSRIIDNDNHDTKSVVDALVSFLPGNDGALCCDFYYTATVTRAIPEGSYFTVTPKGEPLRVEEIINFWKAKLANTDRCGM